MSTLPHRMVTACIGLLTGLAMWAVSAQAQDAVPDLPPQCAAAIAAEPPEDSSPIGHTLNVDEAHAGLIIAASTLWNTLSATVAIPKADVAFFCAQIALMQGTIDSAEIEARFGRDAAVRQLADSQSATARAAQAGMVEALRQHFR